MADGEAAAGAYGEEVQARGECDCSVDRTVNRWLLLIRTTWACGLLENTAPCSAEHGVGRARAYCVYTTMLALYSVGRAEPTDGFEKFHECLALHGSCTPTHGGAAGSTQRGNDMTL